MMSSTFIPVLFSRYFPKLDRRLAAGVQVLLGSLLVAALAQVRVPLPFTPVPITGQTFAVLLVGATMGAHRGTASLLLYLAGGLIGLPIFAGGASGFSQLAGPTGGYLVGFVVAAFLVGRLAERGLDRNPRRAWLVFLAGEAVIYIIGLPWLARFVGFQDLLALGFYPFLLGDGIKLVAAALALPAAWKLVR